MLSRNIFQVRVNSSFFHTVWWFHDFFYSPRGTTLFKVKKNCLISKVLNPWGPGEAVQGKNSYFSFENSSLLVWRIFKTSFNIVKMTEFMLKTDTTTSLGVQDPEVAFSETIWNKKEPKLIKMAKNGIKWPDQKWLKICQNWSKVSGQTWKLREINVFSRFQITVCQFLDFSVIQILREINVREFISSKNCHFCHFSGSEFC